MGLFTSNAMMLNVTAAASTKVGLETRDVMVTEADSSAGTGSGSFSAPGEFVELLL